MPRLLPLLALLLLPGCPGTSLTTCDAEPDLTGHWTLSLAPLAMPGAATIPNATTVEADLTQVKRPNTNLGALVWGTLSAEDKGFFDTLTIPQLTNNNGGKTGAVVGCDVRINVPVTTMVTDDDMDNGPLRLSLSGSIQAARQMVGDPSTVIRVADPTMTPETFTWSAVQR